MKLLRIRQVAHEDVGVLNKWKQLPNCENLSELHTELLNEFSQSYIEDKVNLLRSNVDYTELHSNDLIGAKFQIGYTALSLGEYTWLVLFVGGGTIMVIGENWNGILLFHHFISHQVIMLALLGIPTCEWGAQNGDDHDNVIQARLQNWKEAVSDGGKMTRKFLHKAYWMKLKGQVDYGVMSYQLSTSLDFVGWEALQQWDPGGNHYSPVTCLALSLCFQLWDSGGRSLSLLFYRYNHLEDKVNFKGGSIDEYLGMENLGQTNRFGKVYTRKGRRVNVSKVVERKYVTTLLSQQVVGVRAVVCVSDRIKGENEEREGRQVLA